MILILLQYYIGHAAVAAVGNNNTSSSSSSWHMHYPYMGKKLATSTDLLGYAMDGFPIYGMCMMLTTIFFLFFCFWMNNFIQLLNNYLII